MTSLSGIRDKLDRFRVVIDDGDVRRKAGLWIEQSYGYEQSDSAAGYIENELDEMMAEYPMYHAPDVARAEDAFPEVCEGCQHYPHACPILRDRTERKWRERKLDAAESADEELRVYRRQAIDVGCHVIPSKAEEWREDQQEFLVAGERLVQLALADANDEEPPDFSPRGDDVDLDAILGTDASVDESESSVPPDQSDDGNGDGETPDIDIGPSMDSIDESVLEDESVDVGNAAERGDD
jgi:hypothetical protein